MAISNVLFLRGDLEIQPATREVVTFEYLVDRLADYLLTHAPTDDNNTVRSFYKGGNVSNLLYRQIADSQNVKGPLN